MNNTVSDFTDKANGLTRNPLGIIALFISLIYGFACLVLSTSLNNLKGPEERIPLIGFIIIFPVLILIAFTYLVIYHHKKLYGPSDYKDETNFINTFIGDKEFSADLEKIKNQLKTLANENSEQNLIVSLDKISAEIEKVKEKSEKIPINGLWILNHWGGSCARIAADKMIFTGTTAPNKVTGSHINLNNIVNIGSTYEISCFAKSEIGTTGQFQLWCHDQTGEKQKTGVDISTPYKTPSTEGEVFKLNFSPTYNNNIRIHLQYMPSQGQIEISDVRISAVKM